MGPRQSIDLEAALEVFCRRVLHLFGDMSAEDRDWYRNHWRPVVEEIVIAATNRLHAAESNG